LDKKSNDGANLLNLLNIEGICYCDSRKKRR